MNSDGYPRLSKLVNMLSVVGGEFAKSDIQHTGTVSLETQQLNESTNILKNLMECEENMPINVINVNRFMKCEDLDADDTEYYVAHTGFSKKERQGRMLQGLRLRAELTRKQVAKAIGSNELYIRQYEDCVRRIHPGKIPLLAKLLDTTVDDFV